MLQGPKRLRECRLGGMFHHRGRARREFPLAPWTSVSALGFLFGEFLRLCEWGALCYYIRSIEFARYQVLGCHFNEMLEAVFLRPRKAPCRSGGCTDHASKRFKCIDLAQQAGGHRTKQPIQEKERWSVVFRRFRRKPHQPRHQFLHLLEHE